MKTLSHLFIETYFTKSSYLFIVKKKQKSTFQKLLLIHIRDKSKPWPWIGSRCCHSSSLFDVRLCKNLLFYTEHGDDAYWEIYCQKYFSLESFNVLCFIHSFERNVLRQRKHIQMGSFFISHIKAAPRCSKEQLI